MDWVTGVKLTTLPPPELRALVAEGQRSFLTQLLEVCTRWKHLHSLCFVPVQPVMDHTDPG